MRKLLVHLHIYYHDQIPWFAQKLSNITDCDWDLVVTMSSMNEDSVRALRELNPSLRVIMVGNKGYDVWPFIKVLKTVDLDSYDYVMKLHTKNSNEEANRINGLSLKKYSWRNELVGSLLQSKKRFRSILSAFEKNGKTGLICSYALFKKTSDGLPEDLNMLDSELDRLGIKVTRKWFCAGTMFIARTEPFKFFKDNDLVTEDLFQEVPKSHTAGSMAHVYERILSMIVTASGYKVKTVITDWPTFIHVTMSNWISPFIQEIFSLRRIGEERIKILTLFGMRFKVGGPKPIPR